jgi:4'-phosphopantetheinyl transferase
MTRQFSNTWGQTFALQRPKAEYRAAISLCRLTPDDCRTTAVPHLHPQERVHFDTLHFERRAHSYLLGRYTAKRAAALLTLEEDLSRICIGSGVFEQPVLTVPGRSNLGVTLSHAGNYGIALAFPEEHPMGVDIEEISPRNVTVVEEQMTAGERELIQGLPGSHESRLMMLWSAKEALSKILKTGLTTPLHVYEIHRASWDGEAVVAEFRHFMQYKALLFEFAGHACALALPRYSEPGLSIAELKRRLTEL